MPTIDEIFETMPAEASVNYEELTIDAESRQIHVPDAEKLFGVESDTQAERKHFRCPRYVGAGLDLAGCFLRVNFRNANGEVDSYLITDVVIDGEDVTFSWELSKKVTAYKGEVQFVVCAVMGTGLPEWNTTLAVGEVLEGLEPDSSTVEAETADVIAQLLAMVAAQTSAVEAVGAAQCAEVKKVGENTTQEAKAAVEAKGEAVVASIPADYTALSATVDRLTRDRAAAIVCEAEGETIQVNDSSADPLIGLRLFGKSTQDGTPTPEAPVDIVSAKAPVVTVCGKNHFRLAGIGQSVKVNGLTCSIDRDGVITLDGTPSTITWLEIMYAFKSGTNPQSKNIVALDSTERYVLSRTDMGGTVSAAVSLTVQTDTIEMYLNSPGDWAFQSGGLRRAWLTIQANVVCDNYKLALQIERGSTPTDYEPYRGSALTLSTPDSLPGIPVTSGGNYTDANGQQWIADEVDLARGVYVKRIYEATFTDFSGSVAHIVQNGYTEGCIITGINIKERRQALCSHFVYAGSGDTARFVMLDNGTIYFNILGEYSQAEWRAVMEQIAPTVYAILATPVETPLSTEEIEAYKALLANKPTTTVLNDAGAWMALEYAADPKTYIDNKIAALLAANN